MTAVSTIATWTQQADSATAVVNSLTYDNADQLTHVSQDAGTTYSNIYGYDPAGNRLAETTASGTMGGQFNILNQLTAFGSATTQTVAGYTRIEKGDRHHRAGPRKGTGTISDSKLRYFL